MAWVLDRIEPMIGAIEAFMTADHARLDNLLRGAECDDGTIDTATYAAFRAGLLRHIAMEEKVLIPFARMKRGGEPLAVAAALRVDHGRIAKLLVPTPDRGGCDALRALLTDHNPLEEGSGGLYATCDALAGDEAEALGVVAKLRAQPAVPVAPHYDGPLLHRGQAREGRLERMEERPWRTALAAKAVAARVRRDHATIRALLDAVERACVAAKERRAGGLDSFRRAVWDLYIAFEEHLDMEEADVAPILRSAGATGEARAVAMVLEHNEQRRVILELVEDTECDAKDVDVLVAEAVTLVQAFGTDMDLEDRSLALLLADGSTDGAGIAHAPG